MSKVRALKDFIKRFYLEIIAIVFFIAASIILGFYVAFWDFILAEAIIITLMIIMILILRRTINRIHKADSRSVNRATHAEMTVETEFSKLARSGDRGALISGSTGAPYGYGTSVRPMISMHEMEFGGKTNGKTLFGQVNIPKSEISLKELRQRLLEVKNNLTQKERAMQIEELNTFETVIKSVGGQDIKVFNDDWGLSYSFNFNKNVQNQIFLGATLERNQDGKIVLEGILKKTQPFAISIHNLSDGEDNYSTINDSSLNWKTIYQQEDIKELFKEIGSSLEHLMFEEKYFTAIFKNLTDLLLVIELIRLIHRELLRQEFKKSEIDEITCYKCGTILSSSDKVCSKCSSKRPTCTVCLLDLYPSEKQDVVQTPCCGVYAHKLHMIMWLEKTQKCPNCQKPQIRWLNQLKNSF